MQLNDLMSTELKGYHLVAFVNGWKMVLQEMTCVPEPATLEVLMIKQLYKSKQFREMLAHYEMDNTLRGNENTYERLFTLLKTHIEMKRKQKVRDDKENPTRPRAAASPVRPVKGI